MSLLRPEDRLLLAAARPPEAGDDPEEILRLAAGSLDGRYLYTSARAHGMVPLVAWRLTLAGAEEAMARWEGAPFARHAQIEALRSAFLEKRLGEVLEGLDSAGVRALGFKGPALARSVYGDLARRGFGDLDLILDPADIQAAVEALAPLGYLGQPPVEPWRLGKALAIDCQYALERRQGEVRVELHWGVVRPPFGRRPPFAPLWDQRTPVAAAGFEIPSPGAADLFVLLAVHGFKHRFSRLGWLADLAWLEHSAGMKDGRIVERVDSIARRLDFTVEVEVARELLRRLRQGEPSAAAGSAAPRRARRLADAVERTRFPPHGEPGALERLRFHLAGRSSWSARLRSAAAIAFLPALDDLAAPRLPRVLFPLYYLLRPLLLLRKRGTGGEAH